MSENRICKAIYTVYKLVSRIEILLFTVLVEVLLVAVVGEWIASGCPLFMYVSPESLGITLGVGNSWCSLCVLVSFLVLVLVRYFLIEVLVFSTVWIIFFFLVSFWDLFSPFWGEQSGLAVMAWSLSLSAIRLSSLIKAWITFHRLALLGMLSLSWRL